MGSYGIASSGMTAMQTALSVSTNNITNVDTNGYTKQSSINANTSWSNSTSGVGSGVEVQEIIQIRDKYVDEKYRTELATVNGENAALVYTSEIESIINEISGDGLTDIIDPFFNAWEELAKSPDDPAARALVLENGISLVEALGSADEKLSEIQDGINSELAIAVDRTNTLAGEIADLNEQIIAGIANNEIPTDLIDERNLLLDELSGLTGCSSFESESGSVTVYVENAVLISGNVSHDIELYVEPTSQNPSILWSESGSDLELSSGQVEGLLRIGQEGTLYESQEKLDTLSRTIADMVNTSHEAGYGLEGETGTAFFVTDNDETTFTAENISVNPDLENTDLIAVSKEGSVGDNTIALEIAALRDTAGISDQAQDMVDWIANLNSLSESELDTKLLTLEQLFNERSSTMGVNLDEEMSNLIMYQQAYNASAQVLQVIDELVDLVINGM